MTTEHIPGELAVKDDKIMLDGKAIALMVHIYPPSKHSKRLVLCWNMHDELVEALRSVMQCAVPMTARYVEDFKRAKAILAKVEG